MCPLDLPILIQSRRNSEYLKDLSWIQYPFLSTIGGYNLESQNVSCMQMIPNRILQTTTSLEICVSVIFRWITSNGLIILNDDKTEVIQFKTSNLCIARTHKHLHYTIECWISQNNTVSLSFEPCPWCVSQLRWQNDLKCYLYLQISVQWFEPNWKITAPT